MNLNLPPVYEPVTTTDTDPVDTARRLAEAGRAEGTLVHAPLPQLADCSTASFALILQPDFDAEKTRELLILGTMSLGECVASYIEPMVTLRYGWPSAVRLNDLHVGDCGITLGPNSSSQSATGTSTSPSWATLEIDAHIRAPDIDTATGINSYCETAVCAKTLIEDFCRSFLSLINRWDEEGFEGVSKPWRLRVDRHENERIRLSTTDGIVAGTIDRVDEHGTLYVHVESTNKDSNAFAVPLKDAKACEFTRFTETI